MTKTNTCLIQATLSALFVLAMIWPASALAATTPTLGAAAPYGVLGSTYTNTTATTINGEVGFTTGPAVAPAGTHTNYGSMSPYAAAGADQGSAQGALASQPCTFTFAAGAVDLSTDITHGAIGVYTPGVYCSTGAMNIGGALGFNGGGTYIFRPVGAFTSTAGSIVSLNGVSACDVFWTPTQATTLAANTTFAGTVIDDAGITVGANTTWTGRALSFGGTVTTDTDTITTPTCPIVPGPGSGSGSGSSGINPSVNGPAVNFSVLNQPTMPIPANIIAAALARSEAAAALAAQPIAVPILATALPVTAVAAVPAAPTVPVIAFVSPNFPDAGLPPDQSQALGYAILLIGAVATSFMGFKKCRSH